MRKPLIAAGIIVVVGAILWASLANRRESGTAVSTDMAALQSISARVKATGEITPERKVEISAKVVGEVINLPIVEGQQVAEGDLLVEIERELYESARDQARAALRQAEVALRRVEVQLADARRTLRRTQELHAQGLRSQEAYDAAELAVATGEVEIEAQRHAIEQYRSALKRAEDDLARTSIRSPMDGIVIQLDTEKGETVVPGSTNLPGSVLMTVADMSRLLAEIEVSEVDVVRVALGQEAEVRVDAIGEQPMPGRVVEIATSGRKDPVQGVIRFTVKVALADPDAALRPAMTARVDILSATRENVVVVPIQAVVKRTIDDDGTELRGDDAERGGAEREVVYVVDDGIATIRPVTTGIADELFVEIVDGLEVDEKVVTGPYRTLKDLRDGETVREDEEATDDDDEPGDD
jgi:HlyD family secretion protein